MVDKCLNQTVTTAEGQAGHIIRRYCCNVPSFPGKGDLYVEVDDGNGGSINYLVECRSLLCQAEPAPPPPLPQQPEPTPPPPPPDEIIPPPRIDGKTVEITRDLIDTIDTCNYVRDLGQTVRSGTNGDLVRLSIYQVIQSTYDSDGTFLFSRIAGTDRISETIEEFSEQCPALAPIPTPAPVDKVELICSGKNQIRVTTFSDGRETREIAEINAIVCGGTGIIIPPPAIPPETISIPEPVVVLPPPPVAPVIPSPPPDNPPAPPATPPPPPGVLS